jgi:putative PEP-CTERM system TPR-repeat lipoprotein
LTPLLDDSLDARQFVAISDPTAREHADLEAGRAYLDKLPAEYAGAILADPAPRSEAQDEERSHLRASLEQASDDVQTLLRLANLESRAGNAEETASLLKRAMTTEPYGVQARTLLGQLYLRNGQPAMALRVTETALRRHPRDPVLLGVVGLVRLRLGRAREAKLNFRSLVDLQPESAAAHYLLALAYRDSGDAARFRNQLEQVLARDPGHLGAKIDMGRLLAEEGALGAARDLAERLQETAPEDSKVLELSGAVALLQSRFNDAVALFDRLYARDPTTTAALKLAFVQQRAGDGEGSRATLEHRLESAPGDADARIALANKLLYMGELDQARAHYAKIILLRPNNVVALNNLAWVGMRLGQSDAALYAKRAFQLAPDDPRIMDTYGLVLLEREDAKEAVRVLRRAAKGEPNSLEIQAHLARALARQGHDGEARGILRRVLSENAEFPERNDAEDLLKDLGG